MEEGEEVIHVYPCYGKPHTLTSKCWCQPQIDGKLVIHNASQ